MEPAASPRFHVIVVSDSHGPWLEPCLAAALAQSLPAARVTLLARESTSGLIPPSDKLAEYFPGLAMMRGPASMGFAAAHNRAAATVRDADYLLLLEPESVLAITFLERLATAFRENAHVGVLGGKVLDADVETIQELGAFIADNGLPRPIHGGKLDEGQFQGMRHALCAPIAALAVRSGVWCELGGFDEQIDSMHYAKTDFCFRAQQHNWRIGVNCDASVTYFAPIIGVDSPRQSLEDYFQGRFIFLIKHYRRKDWIKRFVPAELRWLASRASRGQRLVALRVLARGMCNGRERRANAVPPPPSQFKL
jgi:GT2 family glycosyltransferase